MKERNYRKHKYVSRFARQRNCLGNYIGHSAYLLIMSDRKCYLIKGGEGPRFRLSPLYYYQQSWSIMGHTLFQFLYSIFCQWWWQVFRTISLKRLVFPRLRLANPRRFHRKARKTVDMVLSLFWSSSSSLCFLLLFIVVVFILMEFRRKKGRNLFSVLLRRFTDKSHRQVTDGRTDGHGNKSWWNLHSYGKRGNKT